MKKRRALISSTLAAVIVATTLSACGAQKEEVTTGVATTGVATTGVATTEVATAKTINEVAPVSIVNSYDNTEELAAKFPVINPTPIETDLAKKIQNRLLTGFENWNRGYDAWKKWGDILYTKDSIYNIHGVRLTLNEYQTAMDMSLKAADIQMGNFNNMIISGNWAAIRYDITNTDRQTNVSSDGTVMEFVDFKDYGEDLGVRVVEGWAGTIGDDFDYMSKMQTDEEREEEQNALEDIKNIKIPDTNDLTEKYPIENPTPIETEEAKKIQSAILTDFDNWNQGYDTWTEWEDTYYDAGLQYHYKDDNLNLEEYKESVKNNFDTTDVKRIRFNNMLISGDWAAIFYDVTKTDIATGEKTVGTVMQFLHFAIKGDNVKVIECWTK